jgi:hypothetical protein
MKVRLVGYAALFVGATLAACVGDAPVGPTATDAGSNNPDALADATAAADATSDTLALGDATQLMEGQIPQLMRSRTALRQPATRAQASGCQRL